MAIAFGPVYIPILPPLQGGSCAAIAVHITCPWANSTCQLAIASLPPLPCGQAKPSRHSQTLRPKRCLWSVHGIYIATTVLKFAEKEVFLTDNESQNQFPSEPNLSKKHRHAEQTTPNKCPLYTPPNTVTFFIGSWLVGVLVLEIEMQAPSAQFLLVHLRNRNCFHGAGWLEKNFL